MFRPVAGIEQMLHNLTQRITESGEERNSMYCDKEDFAIPNKVTYF